MPRNAETLEFPPGHVLCLNHGADINGPQLAKTVWRTLQSIDSGLPTIGLEGVGECTGDHLQVMWSATSNGQFFALDAMRILSGDRCQFAVCPAQSGETVTFWKTVWSSSATAQSKHDTSDCLLSHLWRNLPGVAESKRLAPKQQPHFMALVAAGLSTAGLSSIKDDGAEVASLRAEVHYWQDLAKTQARLLKTQPKASFQGHVPPTKEPVVSEPRKYRLDELGEWAALNSDRIVIAPRAIAAAKRSLYENPDFVYECLELLAEDYTLTKLGEVDRNAFKTNATNMGLSFGGSVDPGIASSRGEEYFIRWGGRRCFLDQHLGKGSTHDARYTLRIYFTWCEERNVVVVGWLPSHLGTGRT